MGYFIFISIIILSLPIIIFLALEEIPDDVLDQSFMVISDGETEVGIGSVGEMYEMLLLLTIALSLVMSGWMLESFFDMYKARNRKDYNV